ncbi:MAG: hypothetical protein WDM84_05205 [Bauldia sp.]
MAILPLAAASDVFRVLAAWPTAASLALASSSARLQRRHLLPGLLERRGERVDALVEIREPLVGFVELRLLGGELVLGISELRVQLVALAEEGADLLVRDRQRGEIRVAVASCLGNRRGERRDLCLQRRLSAGQRVYLVLRGRELRGVGLHQIGEMIALAKPGAGGLGDAGRGQVPHMRLGVGDALLGALHQPLERGDPVGIGQRRPLGGRQRRRGARIFRARPRRRTPRTRSP